MTGFITHFSKNTTLKSVVRFWVFLCFCALLTLIAQGQSRAFATEITQLRLVRADEGVALSAVVQFELPSVVEDALLKGIPLFFVMEADIYRDRWYWMDPRITSAARTVRLAYQPLTRRWRINVASGLISNSAGLRATLSQYYDSLPEALSAIQRVPRWRIAESSDIESDATYRLEFSFRLDLSQLPRPFQIGMAGQKEWSISAQIKERLLLEPAALLAPSTEGSK